MIVRNASIDRRLSRRILAVGSALALGCAADAGAADYCVGDAETLRAALADAMASPELDRVLLREGEYVLNDELRVEPSIPDAGGLELAGGFGAGCTAARPGAQRSIVRAAAAADELLGVLLLPENQLRVTDLTFDGFGASVSFQSSGADLIVQRVAVLRKETSSASIASFSGDAGLLVLDNVLIAGAASNCATFLWGARNDGRQVALQASFVNSGAGDALCVVGVPEPGSFVGLVNSVLKSGERDIRLLAASALTQNSVFQRVERCPGLCSTEGALHPLSVNNLVEDVSLQQTTDDWLRWAPDWESSPLLIDSGWQISAHPEYIPTDTDVLGRQRTVDFLTFGAHRDRGAFERQPNSWLFCDGFEAAGFACS